MLKAVWFESSGSQPLIIQTLEHTSKLSITTTALSARSLDITFGSLLSGGTHECDLFCSSLGDYTQHLGTHLVWPVVVKRGSLRRGEVVEPRHIDEITHINQANHLLGG